MVNNTPFADLPLNIHERRSEIWLKVTAYLERRVSTLRVENESFMLTEDQTRNIRAQIAVCRQILAAGNIPGQDDVAVEVIGSDGVPLPREGDNNWSA